MTYTSTNSWKKPQWSKVDQERSPATLHMLALVLLLGCLPGCSVSRRPLQVDPCLVPDTNTASDARPNFIRRYFGARYVEPLVESELVPNCPATSEPAPRCPVNKEQRNSILEHAIERCDAICDSHKNAFTSESIFTNLGLSIVSIGLSAAGGLASTGTANALSGASTATQGTEKAISKEVFADKVAPAIAASIDAEQTRRLQLIREHEAQSEVADYPVWAGLRDVQQYHFTCSLTSGLALLQQEASAKNDNAQQNQAASERHLMQSAYLRDAATDALRDFWKPDDKTISKDHEGKLKKWMKDNKIDPDTTSVSFFLRSELLKDARAKAAKDLGLL